MPPCTLSARVRPKRRGWAAPCRRFRRHIRRPRPGGTDERRERALDVSSSVEVLPPRCAAPERADRTLVPVPGRWAGQHRGDRPYPPPPAVGKLRVCPFPGHPHGPVDMRQLPEQGGAD
jgi:hypothetical protein